jgi:hypothetical protein
MKVARALSMQNGTDKLAREPQEQVIPDENVRT